MVTELPTLYKENSVWREHLNKKRRRLGLLELPPGYLGTMFYSIHPELQALWNFEDE